MLSPCSASGLAGSLALVLSTPGIAAPQEQDATSLVRTAHGFVGNGPDYRAEFTRDGFTYVPTRRGRRHVDLALRFRALFAGRRDGASPDPVGDVTPTAKDETVRYVRPGFVETYQLRAGGVEQSFVFEARPPGSGDLIVAGRIDTKLGLVHARANGLRYEAPDGHGVNIGAVLGIDARGATAPGSLRIVGHVIEMSLPAAFVDAAELPIVLDPLIGSVIPVATGHTPAVAFSAAANQYLVAFESGTPATVSGALVQPGGGVGSPFAIAPGVGFAYASEPRVASVQTGYTAFGVAHLSGPTAAAAETFVAGVDATGYVTGSAAVVGAGETHASPDIAGDVSGGEDEVLVVFENVTQGVIQVAEFELDTLTTFQVKNLTTNATNDGKPAISASGGPAGRYLVTWERTTAGSSDIYGAVIDRNLNILVSAFPIANAGADEDDPDVDGDGTNWIVAFERENTEGSGNNNVFCRGVTYDASSNSTYLSAQRAVENDANEENNAAVAWAGESALIAFTEDAFAGDYDLYVKSRELLACRSCEGEFPVSNGGAKEENPDIASQVSGGGTGDGALIVWALDAGGANPVRIEAHEFQATDGTVVDLGGGCAGGGAASVSCALEGTNQFGYRVQHAKPSVGAALMLGVAPLNAPCGPCSLVTNPLVVVPRITDARGNASLVLSLQGSFMGATLISQWAILTPAGGCVVALSNGQAVTIQ